MRKANGLWHHKHPLSARPSFDERCRAVPKHVAETLRERGIELPAKKAS